MARADYKLYAKVDKNNNDVTEFVGTMTELCEYTGLSQNTIRAYISHCKRVDKFCPYVMIGREEEEWA